MQLPAALCETWHSAAVDPALHLPPPNPYIPTDFTVHGLQPFLTPLPATTTTATTITGSSKASAAQPALPSSPAADGAPGQAAERAAKAAAAAAEQEAAAALATQQGLPLVLSTPPELVLDQPGERHRCHMNMGSDKSLLLYGWQRWKGQLPASCCMTTRPSRSVPVTTPFINMPPI
jgi:hypothetical protein